jgi:hypothetical protein
LLRLRAAIVWGDALDDWLRLNRLPDDADEIGRSVGLGLPGEARPEHGNNALGDPVETALIGRTTHRALDAAHRGEQGPVPAWNHGDHGTGGGRHVLRGHRTLALPRCRRANRGLRRLPADRRSPSEAYRALR